MGTDVLDAALALTLGMSVGGGMPSPPRSRIGDFGIVPLARFDDGAFIGRVTTYEGLRMALSLSDPGLKLVGSQIVRFPEDLWHKLMSVVAPVWMFVYMVDEVTPKGWVLLHQQRHGYDEVDIVVWNIQWPGHQRRFLLSDMHIRDAWTWWLFQVLKIKPNTAGWTGLMLPTVVPDESIADLHEAEAFCLREGLRMESCVAHLADVIAALTEARDDFYLDHIAAKQRGAGIVLGRQDELYLHQYLSPWQIFRLDERPVSTDCLGWRLMGSDPLEDWLTRPSVAEVLVEGNVIIEDSKLDDWMEDHLRAGDLLFDPEPFELLSVQVPPLWDLGRFKTWYRTASS